MYIINKTNRIFVNKQSVINHIRKCYDSIEEAYLIENDVKIPKCKFCNNNAQFINFFKGYNDRCIDRMCKLQKISINNNDIGKYKLLLKNNIDDVNINILYNFIIENIDFYKNNQKNINIFDIFTQKNTKGKTLYGYLRSIYPEKAFLKYNICKFCDAEIKIHIIRDDINLNCCRNKKCNHLKLHGYNTSNIIFNNAKDLNNFIHIYEIPINEIKRYAKNYDVYKDVYITQDIIRLHYCPVTGWIIPINDNTNRLHTFLKNNNIDVVNYFTEYFKEQVSFCKFCNKVTYINVNNVINHKNIKFCNKICYSDFKKSNPQLYNVSEQSRQKQSNTMKQKILDGSFTPCVTNSWTHWNASITLEDGSIKKFRSSWDACFWLCNQHLEYETLRIKYAIRDVVKIYIPDFYDPINKIIYEIKPNSQWNKQCNKMQQIITHCMNNDIKFKWINEFNIMNYINELLFETDNLKQLNMLKNGIKTVKNKKYRKN